MGKAADDHDTEPNGRPIVAVANGALRDYVRYENEITSSIERGISDLTNRRTYTTAEVLEQLRERRRARNG